MPWSDSPRLASGSRMYSLLSSHVRVGDGRSGTATLAAHQAASASPTPQSGSARLIRRFIPLLYGPPEGGPDDYPCRLLTAKDRAYFSGSLLSNTLSNSVILVSVGGVTFTPISFIAS